MRDSRIDGREDLNNIYVQVQRDRKIRLQAALATAVGSIAGIIFFTAQYFVESGGRHDTASIIATLRDKASFDDMGRSEMFKRQAQDVLDDFLKNANGAESSSLDFAVLSERLTNIDDRLKLMEKSISDSPERALSLPLLRRDITELSNKFDEYRLSSKVESDRLWSQQNTILQGIGVLLLAVASGAVTLGYRLLKSGRADKRDASESTD